MGRTEFEYNSIAEMLNFGVDIYLRLPETRLYKSIPSNARALNSDTCREYNVFRSVTGQHLQSYGIDELWTINTCIAAMRLKRRDETDFQEYLAGDSRAKRRSLSRICSAKRVHFLSAELEGRINESY